MNQGSYVFAQLTDFIYRHEFNKCVNSYQGNYKIKDFSCWSQFLCMMFGQLTNRQSITDIITCLKSQRSAAYHMGIKRIVSVSTLTRANERRDWGIYSSFAAYLLKVTKPLYYKDNEFSVELENTVYAFDSTTIDLCLSVFFWAKFRQTKAAIKLHTLLDLKGNLPAFILITDGSTNDLNALDYLSYERNAFYIMDRGYIDFSRLFTIHSSGSFFVVRAKNNLQFNCAQSRKVDKSTGLRCDQSIKLKVKKSADDYGECLRRVKYFDKETNKTFVFLTNNFQITALQVAELYKQRWQVELFFKWIKQHLRITAFWGHSPNAVKTQVWIAVCTYLLVAYIKKKLEIKLSLYEILQILSVSIFSKEPLNQLLNNDSLEKENDLLCKHQIVMDL